MTDERTHLERMRANDRASRTLGFAIETAADGSATASMQVTEDMLNGFGVCHGGWLFALADTAFAFACNAGDAVTVAAGASIDFLEPGRLGERLTAVATERNRRRRTGVYDVTIYDEAGHTVALFRGRAHATDRRHDEK